MNNRRLFFLLNLILVLALPIGATALAQSSVQGPDFSGPSKVLSPVLQDQLDARTLTLRNDGSAGLQARRLRGEKAPATIEAVLLMCDFSDSLMLGRYGVVPGDFPPPQQTEIYYAAHDSVFFDHLLRDVADYYADVSGGTFSFNYTIVPEVVNLPNPMAFYGNHPSEGEQPLVMAEEVVAFLDDRVDFSLYDTVLLVHAGAGEETDILGDSPEQIYSTYLDPDDFQAAVEDSLLTVPFLTTDDFPEGEGLDHVLVLPETEYQDLVDGFGGYFGSLGVYCFEVGLRLGMLSLSDFTPAGRPDSQGIGEFGLMGYGLFVGLGYIPPHPCAFNKYLMGWLDPVEAVAGPAQELFLTPCENTADPEAALRVDISGQEYYLAAYRLQDPDGNRRFTHPGDLNGNNIPDFFDADSVFGDGTPTSFFDPATDTRERLAGCEWDFFMSENSARGPRDKGAGSGVYLWHIDEGVILDSFDQPSNLFNADPLRKSVDLEEADGIQDLDSRVPSAFQLGGDDDSFRGEDNHRFGPFTNPGSESAGGAFTGITFAGFSHVVQDSAAYIVSIDSSVSPPDTLMGLAYADTLYFTLSRQPAELGGPELAATRQLPEGLDLRGSHLVAADLDGDGTEEIIAAGRAGELLVFNGRLDEFLDHDSNPETFAPFAQGTYQDEPVVWNLPPAVGNIDDDPEAEIVLTSPDGIYAFNHDGSPVAEFSASSFGLYHPLDGCLLPAVLHPVEADSMYSAAEPALVCTISEQGGNTLLSLVRGPTPNLYGSAMLGPVRVTAPPSYAWGKVLLAVADTVSGEHHLRAIDPFVVSIPENPDRTRFSLDRVPGPWPVVTGLVGDADPESSLRFVIVLDEMGQGETVVFNSEFERTLSGLAWDGRVMPMTGLTAGGALVGEGVLGRVGHNGEWLDGWPVRPRQDMAPSLWGSAPLVGTLIDADLPLSQYLFPVRDGRIFGLGTRGEDIPGWPLAGPGESAGSPALGHFLDGETLDLVAVGTFDRISGLDDEGAQLTTRTVSTLSLWSAVAEAGAPWPMWGASPWHNGNWDRAAWPAYPSAARGSGLVSGSHICYPSPLLSGPLQVRASARSTGRARAEIYNLSGELVEGSTWQPVSAREPFSISLDLDRAVSGMYFCRLTLVGDDGATDHSVISVAVVR